MLASEALLHEVRHAPFYTNLTFACNTETLRSLYSHEQIFVEFDELDRITQAWIWFNYSFTQAQKTF